MQNVMLEIDRFIYSSIVFEFKDYILKCSLFSEPTCRKKVGKSFTLNKNNSCIILLVIHVFALTVRHLLHYAIEESW